jgi:hypothetical protein
LNQQPTACKAGALPIEPYPLGLLLKKMDKRRGIKKMHKKNKFVKGKQGFSHFPCYPLGKRQTTKILGKVLQKTRKEEHSCPF